MMIVVPVQILFSSNEAYLSQWSDGRVDYSSIMRFGSMVAAFKLFCDNFLIGVGFGQSGFLIPSYYPDWIWSSPDALPFSHASDSGGAPTFAFLPKLLAEIGCIGFLFISFKFLRLTTKLMASSSFKEASLFYLSFIGFLIASFGVEGYLYIPAWIILGVVIGVLRKEYSLSRIGKKVLL
jgi:hypothetical protein